MSAVLIGRIGSKWEAILLSSFAICKGHQKIIGAMYHETKVIYEQNLNKYVK